MLFGHSSVLQIYTWQLSVGVFGCSKYNRFGLRRTALMMCFCIIFAEVLLKSSIVYPVAYVSKPWLSVLFKADVTPGVSPNYLKSCLQPPGGNCLHCRKGEVLMSKDRHTHTILEQKFATMKSLTMHRKLHLFAVY